MHKCVPYKPINSISSLTYPVTKLETQRHMTTVLLSAMALLKEENDQ